MRPGGPQGSWWMKERQRAVGLINYYNSRVGTKIYSSTGTKTSLVCTFSHMLSGAAVWRPSKKPAVQKVIETIPPVKGSDQASQNLEPHS